MVEKFWARVRKTPGCWEWAAGTTHTPCGMAYGSVRFRGKMWKAHRVAYTLTNGEIPGGLVVRHKCDNGICVNPDHLELGTQRDNVLDRYKRGRQNHVRGSAHGIAKLNERQVAEIKRLLKEGVPQRTLARRFNVSQYPIKEIAKGRAWRHV